MYYRINIYDLYTFIETNVSETSDFVFDKKECVDNSSFNLNIDTTKVKSLDKRIYLPFDLEKEFENQGYYETIDNPVFSVNSVELEDDYIVSSHVDSKLELVTALDGSRPLNLNFSTNQNKFTGVIEKTNDYIIYVVGADFINNQRIAKTGIFYVTELNDELSTTAYYYPKFFNKTLDVNDFYYKNEDAHKWANSEDVFSQVFIDRGDILNPQGQHELLQLYNNVSDIEDFV